MSIIRNGSNLPSTIKELLAIMENETKGVSGLEEWGQGYRRGIRFGIKMIRNLQRKRAILQKLA